MVSDQLKTKKINKLSFIRKITCGFEKNDVHAKLKNEFTCKEEC